MLFTAMPGDNPFMIRHVVSCSAWPALLSNVIVAWRAPECVACPKMFTNVVSSARINHGDALDGNEENVCVLFVAPVYQKFDEGYPVSVGITFPVMDRPVTRSVSLPMFVTKIFCFERTVSPPVASVS